MKVGGEVDEAEERDGERGGVYGWSWAVKGQKMIRWDRNSQFHINFKWICLPFYLFWFKILRKLTTLLICLLLLTWAYLEKEEILEKHKGGGCRCLDLARPVNYNDNDYCESSLLHYTNTYRRDIVNLIWQFTCVGACCSVTPGHSLWRPIIVCLWHTFGFWVSRFVGCAAGVTGVWEDSSLQPAWSDMQPIIDSVAAQKKTKTQLLNQLLKVITFTQSANFETA